MIVMILHEYGLSVIRTSFTVAPLLKRFVDIVKVRVAGPRTAVGVTEIRYGVTLDRNANEHGDARQIASFRPTKT